ncbi:DEKNAAC105675 [Brettanomyces naardenensis]|uniref:DEKNAAC105675 n=1 Tax=Brettanomyces naardenensis TaxID=13370 RepID=A0A448YTR8_BRENA|nr:DEKNAAC105675 [Brettanomyces naardenensis]
MNVVPDSPCSDSPQHKRRGVRTSKACDYCRSKKIKCDGHLQCSKCSKHNLVCTYNYIAKKRTMPKRRKLHREVQSGLKSEYSQSLASSSNSMKKTSTMESLESVANSVTETIIPKPKLSSRRRLKTTEVPTNFEARLDKMEAMMSLLVSRLAPESQVGPVCSRSSSYDQQMNSESSVDPVDSMGPVDPDSMADSIDAVNAPLAIPILEPKQENISLGDRPSNSDLIPIAQASGPPPIEALEPSNRAKEDDVYERYFGGHTSFSLFSARGLRWIDSKVRDPKVTLPLRNLMSTVVRMEHRMLSVWVDPIEKSQLVPLPSRNLINKFLQELVVPSVLSSLIDVPSVRKLFNLYCDYRDGLIQEPRYTYSELLLMNCTLLISCSLYCERSHIYGVADDELKPSVLEHLRAYLLANALFYYHRVSVVFDGLTGIRGILLLSMYADFVSLSQSAYLMSSTAIRQAQDMGLNQGATYRGLPSSERNKRLLVWWMCYGYDRDLCLRCGKPPIINDDDVSTPPLPGFEPYWNFQTGGSKMSDLLHHKLQVKLETSLAKDGLCDLEQYLSSQFSFIVSRSYKFLFSASFSSQRTPLQINESVQLLLKDLESWRMAVPENIRPTEQMMSKFPDFLNPDKCEGTGSSMYRSYVFVCLFLRYYHMKMMLNRAMMKVKFSFELADIPKSLLPKIKQSEDDGVESCMIILKMTSMVASSQYANFCLYYPFSAFITLCAYCLESPTCENVQEIVQSLIDCTRKFFLPQASRLAVDKWWVVDKITRCMLYIVVSTIREYNQDINFDCDDLIASVPGGSQGYLMKYSRNDLTTAVNSLSKVKRSSTHSKRTLRNVPVASLIAPPPLDYYSRTDEFQQPESARNGSATVRSSAFADTGNFVGNGGFDTGLVGTQDGVLADLGANGDSKSLDNLLELFSKNENSTPTNDSEVSNSDTFQADGEVLFQNMFNIPNMMLDMDGSRNLALRSPSDMF